MLAILWFIFLVVIITSGLVWFLDNNGSVIITWLGYQITTDVLTSTLLVCAFTILISFIAYIFTKILAIKFPALLKLIFKKSYTKNLEKIIKRHNQSFEIMSQLMLALEVEDQDSANKLYKKFSSLLKNNSINNFLKAKLALDSNRLDESIKLFSKFPDNKHAKILILQSKFMIAKNSQDDLKAITYAKQIIDLKKDNFAIAKELLALYKKCGMWKDAKELINQYGKERFVEIMQNRDLAVVSSALAVEALRQKKYFLAIKHAKIALKKENNFLPALEIILKSWIKMGVGFRAIWQIKSMWRETPHYILAQIYDLYYRKTSSKNRIKMMKKLASLNPDDALGKIAMAEVAYRVGNFVLAKEYAKNALDLEITHRAYIILANCEKKLGNDEEYKKNIARAELLTKNSNYICNSCNYGFSKWSAVCNSCGTYDSLDWNN